MQLLLLEDDPNDAFFIRREFQRAPTGVELIHLSNGKEGVDHLTQAYEKHQSVPNAIILDLKMPIMDGFEFLNWLRKDSPDSMTLIPVAVLSSSSFRSDVNRAYGLGANIYLVKPIEVHSFQQAIRLIGRLFTSYMEVPRVDNQADSLRERLAGKVSDWKLD